MKPIKIVLTIAVVGSVMSYAHYLLSDNDKVIDILSEDKSVVSSDFKGKESTAGSNNIVLGKEILSDDAEYPYPVQQLQSVLAYGLVNEEAPHLPLLEGNLTEFSDDNIQQEKIDPPQEIVELRKRIENLNALSQ